MAPTLNFLKPQGYVDANYAIGDTARVPHEIPPKVAARWVEAGIAKWLTEADVRKAAEEVAAADAAKREAAEEKATAARAKAAKEKATKAFAEAMSSPEAKGKRKK